MTPQRLIIETLFRIVDKEGRDRDFLLNPVQARLDSALTGRDVIPKARQEGVSTYILARFTALCLSQRNRRCVVISHDRESTQRMLAKVRYFLENLKCPPPEISNLSKNEIVFSRTNSMFFIGTAGSREFGRGDTITNLHCSEAAYWPNPKDLTAGLFQAVPRDGEIFIESTGNGVGNWYHRLCMRAQRGESQWRLHFFSWLDSPEYELDLSPAEEQEILSSLREEWEEPYLVDKLGLSAGRIAWRRLKLEELDYDLTLFKQEYPTTLDECFQASGRSIFRYRLTPTEEWVRTEYALSVLLGHPRPDKHYILGVDTSAGVGQDASCIQVLCLDPLEQVAEWLDDRVEPDVFAGKVALLSEMFNNAPISVENNNHGALVINVLRKEYPHLQVLTSPYTPGEYGIRTTVRTKPLLIGHLRRLLSQGDLIIHSQELASQLSTYIEHENGKLGAEEGCHDDAVMALAMATAHVERLRAAMLPAPTERQGPRDPFLLDSILDELSRRNARLGYPAQVL